MEKTIRSFNLDGYCMQSGRPAWKIKNKPEPLLNGNDRKKYFETNVCPKCRAWQYVEFMQGG